MWLKVVLFLINIKVLVKYEIHLESIGDLWKNIVREKKKNEKCFSFFYSIITKYSAYFLFIEYSY